MFKIVLFLFVVSIAKIELIKVPVLCPFVNLSSTVHNSSQIEFVECALNEICCQQVEEVITIEENNISVSSTVCCSIRNIILENLQNRNISMADLSLNISSNSFKETSYSSFFNAPVIISISIALILFIILMIIIIIAIKYYKVKLYKERNLITSDYFSNNDKIATISSGGYYNNPAAAGNFIQYGGQQPVSSSSQTYNHNSYVQNSNYAAWKQQQQQSSWAQQYYGGYMNPYYNYYNNNNMAAKSCFYNNNNNLNTFIYQSNEVKKQQQQQQPTSQYNLMKYLRYLNRKTFQTYLEYNQILEYLNK